MSRLYMEQNHSYIRFGCSVLSSFGATAIVHPFDVIKISQQLKLPVQYKFPNIYRGLPTGLLRQFTYSAPNTYLFSEMLQQYRSKYGDEPSIIYKGAMGAISGGIGGITGTPSEVLLVRAIHKQPPPVGMITHAKSVYAQNGLYGFFKGSGASVFRASVFNSVRLSLYSETKIRVQQTYPNLTGTSSLHFISAAVGSVSGVLVSNPIDVIKARIQQPQNTSSAYQLIQQTVTNEGLRGFYRGTFASMSKTIPHSIISFVLFEQLTRWFTGADAI